jgi:predicted membrane chloride channel (bestrophin family)
MPRLWLSGMGIRYWDGRGQLGVMVKSGRELARKIVTYTRIPEDETEDSEQLQIIDDVIRLTNCLHKSIAMAIAHFELLPGTVEVYDLEKELMTPTEPDGVDPRGRWLLNEKEKAALEKAEMLTGTPDNKGRPVLVASLLSHKLYYMYERGWINAAVLKKCDMDVDNYIGAWMACEKIVGVPMVFPYTQMLTIFLVLFVYTFPLPLAHIFFNEEAEFNGFIITPFVSMLVAFAFFGMNAVGIEIENPLGDDTNDLPMKKMCARVGKDTEAILDMRGSDASQVSNQMTDVLARRKAKAEQEARLQREQASGASTVRTRNKATR